MTVSIEGDYVQKLKNIISDYPELKLSLGQLFTTIIEDWLQQNKEVLANNFQEKQKDRY